MYSELTILLIPRDPNDNKNVIVEIRAGAGGEEARSLQRHYSECILCIPRIRDIELIL